MKKYEKLIAVILVLAVVLAMLSGCSSSTYDYEEYDSYSSGSEEVEMGEVIREELGDGPADAYYEGERRWNAMTGQD